MWAHAGRLAALVRSGRCESVTRRSAGTAGAGGGDADLLEQVASFDSLLAAFARAFRGNRRNIEACRFHLELEPCLLRLRRELLTGRYAPRPYRYFYIRHPKRRLISVASFRDRVVHHALVHALEPRFEAAFIRHSYACRKGGGTLRALRKAQQWARAFPFVLKTDVLDYFASVDHAVLLELLGRHVADGRVLQLCERIIANARLPTLPGDARRGLPIGNLTSQVWANVYLDPLDHFVRDELGASAYVRYLDDILVFGHSKARLWRVLAKMRAFLQHRLRLQTKDEATSVAPCSEGIAFLGWRVFPGVLRLGRAGAVRLGRGLRSIHRLHREGRVTGQEARERLTSLVAYARQGAAHSLVASISAGLAEPPAWMP